MAEESKTEKKKSAPKKAASKPKELTDKQLVIALKKVQRRRLSNDDFTSVTRVIRLLE